MKLASIAGVKACGADLRRREIASCGVAPVGELSDSGGPVAAKLGCLEGMLSGGECIIPKLDGRRIEVREDATPMWDGLKTVHRLLPLGSTADFFLWAMAGGNIRGP